MRVGITGTRTHEPGWVLRVLDVLGSLSDVTEVTTGGAHGIDHLAGSFLADEWPAAHHRVCLADDTSQTRDWWHRRLLRCPPEDIEIDQGGTYAERNARIVSHSDLLLALPEWPEDDPKSRRSGTWQTVRMARRAHVQVELHVLRERSSVVEVAW